jgi:hypothetical protein
LNPHCSPPHEGTEILLPVVFTEEEISRVELFFEAGLCQSVLHKEEEREGGVSSTSFSTWSRSPQPTPMEPSVCRAFYFSDVPTFISRNQPVESLTVSPYENFLLSEAVIEAEMQLQGAKPNGSAQAVRLMPLILKH